MALRFAWTDGILDEVDYLLLFRRTREARTMGELRAITRDLAQIYTDRGGYVREEKRERGNPLARGQGLAKGAGSFRD